jgi:hypothetical protein
MDTGDKIRQIGVDHNVWDSHVLHFAAPAQILGQKQATTSTLETLPVSSPVSRVKCLNMCEQEEKCLSAAHTGSGYCYQKVLPANRRMGGGKLTNLTLLWCNDNLSGAKATSPVDQ